MSAEFDSARESFASSAPGRVMRYVSQSAAAAWRSSSVRSALQRTNQQLAMTPAERVRTGAIAVAVAALLQPVLSMMMPAAARPLSLPFAVIAVVALAAAVAWRAESIAATWPSSRLRQLLSPHRPSANERG